MKLNTITERFQEYWPHDDSPGYSDYPEVDIKAHRRNAVALRVFGLFSFIAGVGVTSTGGGEVYAIYGLVGALLCLWAGDNLRLQALEWEIELLKENGE